MDFEVSPVALRQGAAALQALADRVRGDLVATYHAAAPTRSANPDWPATAANDAVVITIDATLAGLASRCRTLAEALSAAALEYERTDENAGRRLAW
ncbi:type VII secretion target [Virgisporangium aurantiacum]|uniref:Uncharacterized protein n=1 Tax=Virgisporangium aurantiacum TaxID=175570 RepID=A0A8J3ZBM9_9ACTN|nr:type VII secretion target [Virgisporangium aurantiacum]GIJ58715.1 hypothetical protein Vau01_062310 [Virgisporangium aurantiacum]